MHWMQGLDGNLQSVCTIIFVEELLSESNRLFFASYFPVLATVLSI